MASLFATMSVLGFGNYREEERVAVGRGAPALASETKK